MQIRIEMLQGRGNVLDSWRSHRMGVKKILFVDDEVELQEIVGDILESEGFQVQLAGSGNCAATILNREKFDLVIVDLHMPDGDGLSLLSNISSQAGKKPLVFLCTGSSDISHEDLINLGATSVVEKPFLVSHLVGKIHALK